MKSIEQTGRTVDAAIDAALRQLDATRDQVEVEVLSHESRGLLGVFGQTTARVRVTLEDTAEPAEPPVQVETIQPAAAPIPVAAPIPAAAPAEEEVAEPPDAEVAERARQLLDEMLAGFGFDAHSRTARRDRHGILLEIVGDEDTALVIGEQGQTLEAFSLLLALVLNRGREDRVRIILDAGGYLERREESLRHMALEAAQKAKATRTEQVIAHLNPRERRIVHVVLADDPDVSTCSVGADPDRRIIITAHRE